MTERSVEIVDARGQRLQLTGSHYVVGRGAESDLRLDDGLASRRHFQLQRTPAGWQVSDLGSSNGTYLNGRRLRPGDAAPVALGDRITVGRTTLLVQLAPVGVSQPPALQLQPRPAPLQVAPAPIPPYAAGRVPGAGRATGEIPLWQWLTAALVTIGAVLTAIGVFQPWVRVDVQLTFRNLPGGDLLEKLKTSIETVLQQATNTAPLVTANSWVIQGMDSYGPVLLLVAGVVVLVAALDLALRLGRSVVPGVVCVLMSVVPVVVLASEAQRFVRLGNRDILFGVNLLEIFKGAEKLIEPKITPLSGVYLTGAGLALLLVAGIFRMAAPLVFRRQAG